MAVHDCGLPIAIENVHNLVRQHGEAQLEHQQYLQNQVALQNAQLQVLQAQQQEFINGRIPPAAPPPVEMARPAIAAAECDGQDLVTFHHHIRPRHQERHRPHNRGWWVDDGDSSDDDADDYYYSSDSEYCAMRRLRPRHRHRHRHRSAVILNNTAPELLGRQTVVPQPQQPRSYGYRRLHVQGGRERGRRRNSCCAGQTPPQRCGRSPRRCILARCCRWLFGDPVVRCRCGQCCTGEPSLRSNSPMRHREEEYWGPGTHDWAYGPPGGGSTGGWRDTPWSRNNSFGRTGGGASNPYGVGPGGVVEEVEEGGTLSANATVPAVAGLGNSDVTHNHYHVGDGQGGKKRGRSSDRHRLGTREYANVLRERERNDGVLGLVDRERDRELDRNMVDREMAKRRDDRLLSLLDRERKRDRGGTDVLNLLERELDRRRDLKSSGDTMRISRAKEEKSNEAGLRAEIRALQKDLKKLLKTPIASRSCSEAKKGSRGRSGGTRTSCSSGRRRPSTAVEVQFDSGGIGGGNHTNSDESEEEDDGIGRASDNDDASSARPGVTGQDIRRRGQSLGIRFNGNGESGSDSA